MDYDNHPHAYLASDADFHHPLDPGEVEFMRGTLIALVVSGVGYAALATGTPYRWTVMGWAIAALGVIPVIAGIVFGTHAAGVTSKVLVRRAFATLLGVFLLYAFFNLSAIRARIHSPNDPIQTMEVLFLASTPYALGAAAVTAITGLLAQKLRSRMQGTGAV